MRFVQLYGDAMYYAPGRWPTRDGIVPAARFDILIAQGAADEARQELVHANASSLGRAVSHARSAGDARTLTRPLRDRAYPEIVTARDEEGDDVPD